MMTANKPADDLRLACRLKRRLVIVFLAGCDLRYDRRPIYEEVLQLIVDFVETTA